LPKEFKNYEGMVAFPGAGEEGRGSTYFTFRIISANSLRGKWVQEAKPAMNIAEHVVKNTQDDIAAMVDVAIRRDLGIE
jgi:hypothetical protein